MEDSRIKYVDMGKIFHNRSNEIKLSCKQANRANEELAKWIAKQHPKTDNEIERVTKLSNYVIRASQLNDQVIDLIEYINELLRSIGMDSMALIEGAILIDKLADQSETIELYMNKETEHAKQLYELRKDQIDSK